MCLKYAIFSTSRGGRRDEIPRDAARDSTGKEDLWRPLRGLVIRVYEVQTNSLICHALTSPPTFLLSTLSLPFHSLPFLSLAQLHSLSLLLSLLFFSALFLPRLFSPSLASPVRYWQPSQPKRQPTKNPGPWRLLISSLFSFCCLRVEKTFSILVFEAKTKREARLLSLKKMYRQNSWKWNEFWKILGDWDSFESIDKMFANHSV